MLKNLLKDGALYSLSDILSKGLSFFLLPLYTRSLTPTDYGIIDIMSIFSQLIIYVIGLEISQSLIRFIPSIKDKISKVNHLSTAFWFIIFVLLLFSAVCAIFNEQLAELVLESRDKKEIFSIGILALCTASAYYFIQTILRVERKIKLGIVLNFTNLLITTFFSVYLIIYLKLGVLGSFYAIFIGSMSSILVFFFNNQFIRFNFNYYLFLKLVKFSIPLIPASLAVYVTFYIDRIFIKEFLSISDLGIYGISVRFATITNIFTGGFLSALGPLIFLKFEEKETPNHIEKAFMFFITAGSIIILGFSLFSREVVEFLVAPAFTSAFQFIPILTFNIILYNCYVFFPGLSIAKKTYLITIINFVSGAINIGLNYFLIIKFGIWGSLIATTISSVCNIAMLFYFNNKYYFIPFKLINILMFLVGNLVIVIVVPLLLINQEGFRIEILLLKLVLFITALGLVFIINKNDFYNLFKLKNVRK